MTAILLTEGAGGYFEHVLGYFRIIVNDKINEVRRTAYQCVAQLLNGFAIENLKKFEADLVILLLNSLSDE